MNFVKIKRDFVHNMPIIKSAIKRMRQATKARARNAATKRGLKASVKTFKAKLTAENLKKAQSNIDKAVKKNLLNKNTAARQKAAMARTAKAAGIKVAAGAKKAAPKVAAKKPAAAKPAAKTPAKKAAK